MRDAVTDEDEDADGEVIFMGVCGKNRSGGIGNEALEEDWGINGRGVLHALIAMEIADGGRAV